MLDPQIKDYLASVGIRRVSELDTALSEAFGQAEGSLHIERMTKLFDLSEERLVYGTGGTPYLHRQQEFVDYINQSAQLSLLAASFYDHVFFKRVMEYLLRHERFFAGDIWDIGCGNGILTCFLALRHPASCVTGLDLSPNAVSVAEKLAECIHVTNVCFAASDIPHQKQCDTLFSCRTVHENVAWRALCEESRKPALSVDQQADQHFPYAKKLAGLLKPKGYLVSIERYEDDDAYAGLLRALGRAGLCQVRGTSMQFSCKNGDKTAAFQAVIVQRTEP